ncbi:hypothetical protein BH11PSE6_BH11PSE6_03100 [soil metagenome]
MGVDCVKHFGHFLTVSARDRDKGASARAIFLDPPLTARTIDWLAKRLPKSAFGEIQRVAAPLIRMGKRPGYSQSAHFPRTSITGRTGEKPAASAAERTPLVMRSLSRCVVWPQLSQTRKMQSCRQSGCALAT